MFQFAKLKNGIIRPGGKISAEGIEDGHCEHFFAFFCLFLPFFPLVKFAIINFMPIQNSSVRPFLNNLIIEFR